MIVTHPQINRNHGLRLFKFYLFLFLASSLILMAGGTIQSSDAQKMYEVTKSIVQRGEFSVPPDSPHVFQDLDGKYYTGSGIGQSVIAIPLYVLGAGVSKLTSMDEDYMTEFTVSMLNPIVFSLICVVLFSLGLKIGYTVKASFVVSLCFVFSTMVLPYAKTFLNHPLTILFLLLSVYYIVGIKAYDKLRGKLLLSGLYLGLTIIVRQQMIVVIPVFLIFLLPIYLESNNVWSSVKRYFKGISFFITPVCLGLFIIFWYDLVRFGNPFLLEGSFQRPMQAHFGHLLNSPFSWVVGVVGLLFSPGKGVFWYNPILFLFPLGFFYLRKNYKREAFLFLSIISAVLIFYSLSRFWYGAMVWGPRYIMETVPFFVLISYYACKNITLKRVAIVLTILSFLVQLPAIVVSYRAYPNKMQQEYEDQSQNMMIYTIRHSPIIGQWKTTIDTLKSIKNNESNKELALAKIKGEEEDNPLLTIRTPYFWFYYLYLLDFPPLLIMALIGFLLSFTIFSLFKITKLLKEPNRIKV